MRIAHLSITYWHRRISLNTNKNIIIIIMTSINNTQISRTWVHSQWASINARFIDFVGPLCVLFSNFVIWLDGNTKTPFTHLHTYKQTFTFTNTHTHTQLTHMCTERMRKIAYHNFFPMHFYCYPNGEFFLNWNAQNWLGSSLDLIVEDTFSHIHSSIHSVHSRRDKIECISIRIDTFLLGKLWTFIKDNAKDTMNFWRDFFLYTIDESKLDESLIE